MGAGPIVIPGRLQRSAGCLAEKPLPEIGNRPAPFLVGGADRISGAGGRGNFKHGMSYLLDVS